MATGTPLRCSIRASVITHWQFGQRSSRVSISDPVLVRYRAATPIAPIAPNVRSYAHQTDVVHAVTCVRLMLAHYSASQNEDDGAGSNLMSFQWVIP
jgi:hypothetical protein